MPIVINEVSVEPAPAPSAGPAAPPAPAGPSEAAMADIAERMWRRVSELRERVHAD